MATAAPGRGHVALFATSSACSPSIGGKAGKRSGNQVHPRSLSSLVPEHFLPAGCLRTTEKGIEALAGCLARAGKGPDPFSAVQAMRQSAGTLLYRGTGPDLEVLLVHPSGAYNRRAPWSIPKGEPGDDKDLEATARRETEEETGVTPGRLAALGYIDYRKSRKRVHCFAGPAPAEAEPRCASWEVDQARFVSLDEARTLLHPDQHPFLDRLVEQLRN